MQPCQIDALDRLRELTARLMRVVCDEIGLPLELSLAQEVAAQLLGYDSWSQLRELIAQRRLNVDPSKRSMPRAAKARRKRQIHVLQTTLNVPEYVAADIREAIAPPGYDPDEEDVLANRPSARRLNLPLTTEDELWLARALVLTAECYRTVMPIYKIDPEAMHIVIDRSGEPYMLRSLDAGDVTLSAHERLEIAERETTAAELVSELARMVGELGKAPFLFPRKSFALSLRRTRIERDGRRFWTYLGPEPWLEMSYCFPNALRNIDVDWPASRSLQLLLGLRREFLESGWTDEGPEWEFTLGDRKDATVTFSIRAPDAGKAAAGVVAACASLKLANRHARTNAVVLLRVRGPAGPIDPNDVVAAANEEPLVKRGKLFLNGKLTARGRHREE